MIEVHNDPQHAMCDGAQSLTPEAFAEVCAAVSSIVSVTKENGGAAK
jgi:3-deoxy-7-phosphoheptulonate synthase